MEMEDGYGHKPEGSFRMGEFDCQEAIQTLYYFLDGELTEDRRKDIQRHLEECSPCLEAFDFEAELKIVIARKCRDQVPPALRDRVAHALSEASKIVPGSEQSGGMPHL
jgi:mycothiol system anti-sigma-R factor